MLSLDGFPEASRIVVQKKHVTLCHLGMYQHTRQDHAHLTGTVWLLIGALAVTLQGVTVSQAT